MKKLIAASLFGLMATGCNYGAPDSDLTAYVQSVKQRPAGPIDPVPAFRPYESFSYSAMLKRSPFDRPVVELQQLLRAAGKTIQPDFNREREHLENFPVGALSMVGTIKKDGVLWGLVSDGQGGVHRVRQGNYLGRNHGKVITVAQTQLEFIEIISDGLDGWVERPRSLRIEEKE
ncbi:pilus assembly protein PilP [Simiduia agarivorans]|uniref:Type 4 fimbrial biogenesis protein PilP n=1 Tax=Simiduia agarivorans (strain DSM 21679 / JCM 13881 / BCRC 17597 / SA1) TaxID=1117647 RepID=K4L1M9_SIMAS|nr:pilus assembly protein PilP [Simiduia agarivorans]AFV00083.1 type 4 fimbrial biogenesis protein PilP [Simiduia agarivorans SA1 = DSM 21679]